jgi:DNA-binding response OmpR family regulator
MSGIDLLDELRRRSVHTPALMITSNPSRILQSAAHRLGVRIIEKPLLTNALSECVREICGPPDGQG